MTNILSGLKKPHNFQSLILTGVLIGLMSAVFLSIITGRSTVQSIHTAYLSGDCLATLSLYEDFSKHPALFNPFLPDVSQEQIECTALTAATNTEKQNPQTAIIAYEQFINRFEDSPLTTPALAAIHRLYLEWAAATFDRGNYPETLTILEKATADYPALEAETEERILTTYLAWAESLKAKGDANGARSVYQMLQSRYPQFTAEAQMGIESLKDSQGE